MDKNRAQEMRCRDLLRRINVLQIDALQNYIRKQCSDLLIQVQRAGQSGDTVLLKETIRRLGYSSSGSDTGNKSEPPNGTSNRRKSSVINSGVPNAYESKADNDIPQVLTELSQNDTNNNIPKTRTTIHEQLQYARYLLNEAFKEAKAHAEEDTESSSEEDSCDELEIGTKKVEHYLPVEESPETKWTRDRGELGSSWTWLEDVITETINDLKQQEDFRRQVRTGKASVAFGEPPQVLSPLRLLKNYSSLKDARIDVYKSGPAILPSISRTASYVHTVYPVNQRVVPFDKLIALNCASYQTMATAYTAHYGSVNLGRTTSCELAGSAGAGEIRNTIGGGLEPLMINLEKGEIETESVDPFSVPRRCLPLKQIRPRKLFRVLSPERTNPDPQENSGLWCNCKSTESCSLCTDDFEEILENQRMPYIDAREGITLLDHSYHRNLSITDEIPVSALLSASLVVEGWKHNTPKSQSTFRSITPRYRTGYERMKTSSEPAPDLSQKKARGRPKAQKKPDETIHNAKPGAAKGFKKGGSKVKGKRLPRRPSAGFMCNMSKTGVKRKKCNSLSSSGTKKKRNSLDDDSDGEHSDRYLAVASPKLPGRPRDSRRKRDQDYDINNIVIPYSVAASTRVEKIEYKEIMTPSWRVLPSYEQELVSIGKKLSSLDQQEIEDLSEELIIQRHEKCEIEERKRFYGLDKPTTSRRGRRTYSKTETAEQTSASESPKTSEVGPPSPSNQQDDAPGSAKAITASDATMAVSAVKVNAGGGRRRRMSFAVKKEDDDDWKSMDFLHADEVSPNLDLHDVLYCHNPQVDFTSIVCGLETHLVCGFELRQFPIPNAEYNAMLEEMPEGFFCVSPQK